MNPEIFTKKSLMEFSGSEIAELQERKTSNGDPFIKVITKGGVALFCYDQNLVQPIRDFVSAHKKLDMVCAISGKTRPLVDVATWRKNEGNGAVPTVSDVFFKILEVWEAKSTESPRLILNSVQVWSAFSIERKAGNGSNFISFSARDPETKQVFEVRCFDDSELFRTVQNANLKKGDRITLTCEVSRVRRTLIADAALQKKYGISDEDNKGVKYYYRPLSFRKEET